MTEDFINEAHRRIEAIVTATDYAATKLWVLGSPDWHRITDDETGPLLEALEGKRVTVARRAFGVGAD